MCVCGGGKGAQKHPHPTCARVEREGYRTSPRGTELLLSFLSVTRFLEKKTKNKSIARPESLISASGFRFQLYSYGKAGLDGSSS